MVKVIMTILLLIIGSKTILDGAATAYKDSFLQTAPQEEDNKNDKEDKKSSKKSVEELYCSGFPENASSINAAMSYFPSHQKPYNQFVDKLNTPPPDGI